MRFGPTWPGVSENAVLAPKATEYLSEVGDTSCSAHEPLTRSVVVVEGVSDEFGAFSPWQPMGTGRVIAGVVSGDVKAAVGKVVVPVWVAAEGWAGAVRADVTAALPAKRTRATTADHATGLPRNRIRAPLGWPRSSLLTLEGEGPLATIP